MEKIVFWHSNGTVPTFCCNSWSHPTAFFDLSSDFPVTGGPSDRTEGPIGSEVLRAYNKLRTWLVWRPIALSGPDSPVNFASGLPLVSSRDLWCPHRRSVRNSANRSLLPC